MNLKSGYQMIKTAASDFAEDNAMTLAAPRATYAMGKLGCPPISGAALTVLLILAGLCRLKHGYRG